MKNSILLCSHLIEKIGNLSSKIVEKFKDSFYEMIEINEERNRKLGTNKQEINGAIIYRQLIKKGYDIGVSTIRNNYSKYRNSKSKVFIKQVYEYGDRVEFDFHVVKLLIEEK